MSDIRKFDEIKIRVGERLAYGLANMGGNLVYTTISSFVTLYYTNSVGISAAVAGTMMLIARIFDGLSDVIMGGIIDKTHTKIGQARPWFIASIVPLVLSLILVFSVPQSFSPTAKIIYMYLTYIFSAVFCFTANNLAIVAMQALMTGNQKERMSLNAVYQILGFVIIIVLNMFTANVYTAVGWQMMAIIYGLASAVCLFIAALVCKERKHVCESEERIGEERKVVFKRDLPILLRNKYFWIILLLSIMIYISIGTFNGGGIYFCIYILGNPSLFGLMTIAGMGPTIICSGMVPAVAVRIGKRNTIILGFLLQTFGYAITFLANANLPLIIIGLVIKGVGLAGVAGLLIPMIGDVIDYGEKKTGVRLDGLTNSVSSCGIKVGTGLGAALVGWMLALGMFDATAEAQGMSALFSMRMLVGGIPAVCCLVGVILAIFFNIEKDIRARE